MEKNLDYGYYYNKEIPEGIFCTSISKNSSNLHSDFFEDFYYLTKNEHTILKEKANQRNKIKSDINFLIEKDNHIKYTIKKFKEITIKIEDFFQKNMFLKSFNYLNWDEYFMLKITNNIEYSEEYKKELINILIKEYEEIKLLLYKYNRALRMVKSLNNDNY